MALTVCRGRSHDEYYFDNIDRIISDPPPAPYLDLNLLEILRRVLSAEALRRAFQEEVEFADKERNVNVHGQFGEVRRWDDARKSAVKNWLEDNEGELLSIADALLRETPESTRAGRDELVAWVVRELPDRLDAASQDLSLTQPEMSERLANAGQLPMFGFPTSAPLVSQAS